MKLKSELDMQQLEGILAIIDPLRLAPGDAALPADGKHPAKDSTHGRQ
jgi:hypothetical protein